MQAGVELLARLMLPSYGFDMVYDRSCLAVTSTSLPAKEDVETNWNIFFRQTHEDLPASFVIRLS